ncbi:MAG: AAA family ATPase [Cyanobacteria bacterium]|nr:AAA family ATPase [Cyanobacteriota bacterium]
MRLLDCRLQNLRLHGDLPLQFAPGLTLIGGPNETGKSTLVEALHRGLFLKAAASGTPVENLRSRCHSGHPIVELGFEARGERWRLIKRFTGTNGTVSLTSEHGNQLCGAAAEETLATLLGVGEIVGSKQAGSVLPSRWAHLWVMQGSGGDDLLARGGSHYDLDALINQLEQGGGAAMQSPLDQLVAQGQDALLAVNFTGKRDGIKKNSPLWQAQQALLHGEQALEQARTRLADYEQASDDLARTEEALAASRQQQLPALEAQQQGLKAAAEALRQLEAAIDLRRKDLMPLRLHYQDLQQDLRELQQLDQDLASGQQQQHNLSGQRQQANSDLQTLEQELMQARAALATLSQQLDCTLQRGQLLLKRKEQSRQEAERQRLQHQLQQRRQRQDSRRALQSQLAALTQVSGEGLAELQQRQQARRDAATRIEALATGVQLLRAEQPVRIDGQPLQPGEERRLTQAFELQVGEAVHLRISPGGGEALGDSEGALHAADAALHQALVSLGVASVSEAEAIARQRETLLQQLSALAAAESASDAASPLPALQGQSPPSLEAQLARLEANLAELQRDLEGLEEQRLELEVQQPLPENEAGLESLHRQLQQTYRLQRSARQRCEQELQQLDSRQRQASRIAADAAQALAGLEAEWRTRQQRQRTLLERRGSAEALSEALQISERHRIEAEAELAQLQQQRQALQADGAEARLQAIEGDIDKLQQQICQLVENLGGARERCESISAEAPHAAVERAQVARDAAAAEWQALNSRAEAQKLLAQLFHEARSDLSSRYSLPLARSIERFLLPLLPEGPNCQLQFDQAKGFWGLQLRRSGEYYPFSQLSGGMREQLAAALRLAMADVLKGGHDGCLPLIFDDAFTNSDLERLDGLKGMLQEAVRGGLQLILLTCHPERYRDLDATAVDLRTEEI